MVLSPHNHRGREDQERQAEDVAEGNFEVGLVDVGVEDEDIASLRRIEERLAAKMRERTVPANIQTRAQAEAANSFGPCCWQSKLLAKLDFFANSLV
jgi:hypothetical protein